MIFHELLLLWPALLLFVGGSITLFLLVFWSESYSRFVYFSIVCGSYGLSAVLVFKQYNIFEAYYGLLLISTLLLYAVFFVIGIVIAYLKGPRLIRERMRVAFVLLFYLAGMTVLFLVLVVLAARSGILE
ncbi:hypothetical protein CBW65_22375 [Tumebacillus avium]|uniref:Uncharacterized protein n=2 Tax=Tumebacillus avium TaxID=1903704 RepID=A0A1Y0IVL5_9BACL|nr:hypothetical protein CBW65_22375 [Tumebacillus avium]